jgi:hypothetical protein
MSSHWFTRLLLTTTAGALLSSGPALADPASRVARISFVGGSVSLRPASADQWSAAALNYPLSIGDHVWTDRGARSELQLGSTVVRLAPLSEFSVLNLDDHTTQLRLTQGSLLVRVRTLTDPDVVEIDAPNGAVTLLRPGLYRVDVDEAGDKSTVTVREGEANVATATAAFTVARDHAMVLTGFDSPQADLGGAIRIDEFEDWSLTRDRRSEHLESVQYVSPETIGYEDLDANGHWMTVAEYGPVWIPRVRAEWVPYRFGRWAWIEPWGWTWIDEAPWGFAPFHYGRWAYLPARGWAWVPGRVVARPVYAPALVAFVGGPGWNVSTRLGSGPVGWFPLGPREPYLPAYRVTPEYVQRINVSHVTNTNVTTVNVTTISYVNRTVPGALTAVPRDAFARARPVATVAVVIPREQAQTAPVVDVTAVAPRESIANPPHPAAAPPPAAVSRQVIVRRPPPMLRGSFAARDAAPAQDPGQPLGATSAATPAQPPASSAAAHPLVRAVAAPPSASTRSTVVPRAATSQPSEKPVSRPAPSPTPTPAPAVPASGANAAAMADLLARHARERANLDARHTQERIALQARHEQERQATKAADRAQLQQRHQQETKALQERQQQERAATQKRQQEERQKQK